MVRCIVADDEPLAKMLIESYIRRTDGMELVGAYTSSAEAATAIERGDVDLAFLDIQMPGLSGLQLAAVAEKRRVKVVFTTAYRDYAIDGFRVNALDYLLKPISYDEFMVAARRAFEALSSSAAEYPVSISVKSNYRVVNLDVSDIAYIEGLRDYVRIHRVADVPIVTQISMKTAAELLPPPNFVRIHRSYIVARQLIKSYNKSCVTLAVGPQETILPIGDTYRAEFQNIIESKA